ncbi:oxygen-insensitive NAD(P)H nitroreductase [Motiliproteus sp. MSK22-1]|uniref:oxygen-insensitive NAD(P)H nitroreductase n=1 Tax=Motiliproteus sp. MSK22-1 TaxID=1897630 RepID=UPI0009778DEA|nr:oxygen-insensitive NAD(P)H nitroreductase [Motiliproteus sp. MSK22-1]OMH39235.1 NAD(P)H nitroreductase [Motiliproteus sp. MSK22-1]
MNIEKYSKERYTTKVFDSDSSLSDSIINKVKNLLQVSPSSVNSQPWHFIIAGTESGKQRIAKAASGAYEYNKPKLTDSSHVIVFCSKTSIDDDYLEKLLDQEDSDGRFANGDFREAQRKGRSTFVNLHKFNLKDSQHWMEKQVYLALGTLLLGASTLEIDACPMEGFDPTILDQELGLREKGLTSVVLVAIGKRSPEDFNAPLPKSRHKQEDIFTNL